LEKITVKTAATTANMGPGFDCMAMALDIWNTTTVQVIPPDTDGPVYEVHGHGSEYPDDMYAKLVLRCFELPFTRTGKEPPSVKITCNNDVPAGKGLGSSAAAIVAGLVAGDAIAGSELSEQELLDLAVEVEGHPDNVVAALYGGCRIVVPSEEHFVTAPVPVPEELRAVLYVPERPMPTKQAREILPDTIDREDVVFNLGRVGLLVRALTTGDLSLLGVATQDKLHQSLRIEQFFGLKNVFTAARAAGALGVFLSGSGSSVLALTAGRELTIGYEMADAADKSGITGDVRISKPTSLGFQTINEPGSMASS
jgi:homoserine kinase